MSGNKPTAVVPTWDRPIHKDVWPELQAMAMLGLFFAAEVELRPTAALCKCSTRADGVSIVSAQHSCATQRRQVGIGGVSPD